MDGSTQNGRLNEAQQRRLSATCVHIDKLLSDIEEALGSSDASTPFCRYVADLTPAHAQVLQDQIRRLRTQLVEMLKWQELKPEPPRIPLSRSILSDLAFVDIALEELNPSYMRGSGDISPDTARELSGVVFELRSLIRNMERYVREETNSPLSDRISALEEAGCDVELLRTIEELVTGRGLVEFRSRIEALTSALEESELEIAVFGRVNSGKSSLLNALLGMNVLPVGVNPITAVPTKLKYGDPLRAAVRYISGLNEVLTIHQFRAVVSEQGNPSNTRKVAHAVLELPVQRLKPGVVLVDTPGLGSLAKQGARETMAYLPACDLGLVLVDAATTLTEEDIGTLRSLSEAGIPAVLLLSKADLLGQADLKESQTYIHDQVLRALGLSLPVDPVSSLSSRSELLDQFFERELLTRFSEARALRSASLRRKIGVLRDSVIAAFEALLAAEQRQSKLTPNDIDSIEGSLRNMAGAVAELRKGLEQAFFELGELPDAMIKSAADLAISRDDRKRVASFAGDQIAVFLQQVVSEAVARAIEMAREIARQTVETLRSAADQIGHVDAPSAREIDVLLRDVPVFNAPGISEQIELGVWKLLGREGMRRRLSARIRDAVGLSLTRELHRYGQALSLWGRQFSAALGNVTDSYSEMYRAQLRRISGNSNDGTDKDALERDLDRLRNWALEESDQMLRKPA